MQVKINVFNKIASAEKDYKIVCGNSDYTILFNFDSEWDNQYVKTAYFIYLQNGAMVTQKRIFTGNECEVPVLFNIDLVDIGVFAGNLQTTTTCTLACDKGTLYGENVPSVPDEDVYNQLVALCNEAVMTANDALDTAGRAEEIATVNEELRIVAEQKRVQAENNRVIAEEQRDQTESTRIDAENNRTISEETRVVAENERQNNETLRQTNEQERVAAEQERIANEETRQATFDSITNLVANALRANASGEVVRVDDVSPIEHIAKARVSGKNLCPSTLLIGNFQTTDGVLSDDDGYRSILVTLSKGFYTLSCDTEICLIRKRINGKVSSLTEFVGAKSYTFEIDKNSEVGLSFRTEPKGGDFNKIKIQLERGDTATEYESYIDPTTVTLTRCGKNFLPYPYFDTTKTVNGAIYTDHGDGTIHLSGTPTDYGEMFLYDGDPLARNGKFVFSGLNNANNVMFTFAITSNDELFKYEITHSKVVDLDEYPNATRWTIGIKRHQNGVPISGTVFPLLENGENISEYEPYKGAETCVPSSDGTCEIVSVSPTMTLLTDTKGVTIDLEYNQDANKALENIRSDMKNLDNVIAELITKVTALESK